MSDPASGITSRFRTSGGQQALEVLGARLRELRIDAGLSGLELARLTGWHASKVSRIEHGRQAPSVADVRSWCVHTQSARREDDLLAWLRSLDGMWLEWARKERGGFRPVQEVAWAKYERVTRLHVYCCWLIPGLLQTKEYTREILHAIRHRRNLLDDVDEAVAIRMQRQRVLFDGRRQFSFLIEESVMRNGLGGAEVMAAQLGHLLICARLPTVSLGIIPMNPRRSRAWPVEEFYVFDERRVEVELVSGFLQLTQPYDLALYTRAFSELFALAVHGEAAKAIITAAIAALEADPHQR